MKLYGEQNQVEVVGASNGAHSFTMNPSAKAFNILVNSIYSNKIAAVIRELSTNAFDSHVEAGCADKPFDVHLPNALEPWFSVEDFGVGISPEDFTKVYTVFFESTRNDSNDFTGALGLGCKSPFAYTTQFSVISRYNGEQRTYSAFINNDGFPHVVQMGDAISTDEQNGVKVVVPVEAKDYPEFCDASVNIYQWFAVKPNVVGNNYYQEAFERNSTNMLPTAVPNIYYDKTIQYYSRRNFLNVVMGNVAYSVNNLEWTKNEKVHKFFRNVKHCLYLYLNIGSVDISASREHLSFIPETVKYLEDTILNLIDVEYNKITSHFTENNSTGWEKSIYLTENVERHTPAYGAWVLHEKTFSSHATLYKGTIKRDYGCMIRQMYLNDDGELRSRFPSTLQIKYASNVKFVTINDNHKSLLNKRIAAYIRNNPGIDLYLIKSITEYNPRVHTLISDMGEPSFISSKDLPEVSREARKTYKKRVPLDKVKEIPVFTVGFYGDWNPRIITDDPEKTYYYVELKRKTMQNISVSSASTILNNIGPDAMHWELQNITFVGVRADGLRLIESRDNWIPIEGHLKRVLKEVLDNSSKKFVTHTMKYTTKRKLDSIKPYLDSEHPLTKVIDSYNMISENTFNNDQHRLLREYYREEVDSRVEEERGENPYSGIFNKYPLVRVIDGYEFDPSIVLECVKYINAVDSGVI